jgi:hypothetical protein
LFCAPSFPTIILPSLLSSLSVTMKVMITTCGGDIDLHNKIVDIMNKIYNLRETGSNGGKGYYFTNADEDYPHITTPFQQSSTFCDVEIEIGTLPAEDDDEDEDDE